MNSFNLIRKDEDDIITEFISMKILRYFKIYCNKMCSLNLKSIIKTVKFLIFFKSLICYKKYSFYFNTTFYRDHFPCRPII